MPCLQATAAGRQARRRRVGRATAVGRTRSWARPFAGKPVNSGLGVSSRLPPRAGANSLACNATPSALERLGPAREQHPAGSAWVGMNGAEHAEPRGCVGPSRERGLEQAKREWRCQPSIRSPGSSKLQRPGLAPWGDAKVCMCTLIRWRGDDVQVVEKSEQALERSYCARQGVVLGESDSVGGQGISLLAPLAVAQVAAHPVLIPPIMGGRAPVPEASERQPRGGHSSGLVRKARR